MFSIKFKFLLLNKVPLTPSLWLHSIHSRNNELIHLLEEKNVEKPDNSWEAILKESIKCHHNEISNYILSNYIDETNEKNDIENKFDENIYAYGFHYNNYDFIPDDIQNKFIFYYACRYNYIEIVKILLKDKNLDINSTIKIKKYVDDKFLLYDLTALNLAASKGNDKVLNLLLSQPGIQIISKCFISCQKLRSITLTDEVSIIGQFAFYQCNSLEQITLPSSLRFIKNSAFNSCPSLKEISIPSSLVSINSFAFHKCFSLEHVSIPSSIVSVGNSAFSLCKALKEFSFPSSVTTIGDWCFSECINLEKVTIPPSVTMIGENAFHGCKELEQITIPDSVVMIKSGAFKSCVSLKELIIPSGVKSIGSQAFYECTSLKEIKLPPDITVIAEKTFQKCQALTQIDIPSKVKSIEKYSFSSCSSLEKITIPSSVISIEPFEFEKCSKLTKMDFELPSSLSEICPLTFGTSNNLYLSQSNFGCCQPHTPITEIFIPSSITTILPCTFEKCFYLTKITFEMTS